MTPWQRNGLQVRWLGGGLLLQYEGMALVLDAPPACAEQVAPVGERVIGIGISSGRIQAVGGLLPLLVGLERHRHGATEALQLHVPLWDDRPEAVIDAWSHSWRGAYRVIVDGEMPGVTWEAGPFVVETVPVRHGEPRWGADPGVDGVVGIGFRARAGDTLVSWVPGAGPSSALRHLGEAHLAVVEVGVAPWPPSNEPWRLTIAQAIRWFGGAGELWLMGDDGHRVDQAQA